MHQNLKKDRKAKTPSFFLKKEGIPFNQKLINFIINYYKKNNEDIRICMHPSIKAKHHDMIILQQRKNFYAPHKHLRKGETYHIIKGAMACVLFSEKGKIKKICKLKKNNIFRTPINIFHTMLPLTKYVIYHECKVGPFLKINDSIFNKWSKKLTNDQIQIKTLKNKIFSLAK
tara:strand:+ start:3131 stop:3649 length:519 start_codon:yes stop_codon:yes gene_type:complete